MLTEKKRILKLSYFSIAIVGFFFIYKLSHNRSNNKSKKSQKNIALITKTTPYHDSVAQGFKKALLQETAQKYNVQTYITEGQNKMLSGAIIEKVLEDKPDLICTIGATLTQVAHSITEKRNLRTPIVFAGAADPVGLGVVKSIESSGNNITGVNMSPMDDLAPAKILLFLKPTVRNILLPFCPLASGGNLEKQAEAIKTFMESRSVHVRLVPIHKQPEILPKVKGALNGYDTIMYLSGCLVDEAAEGLSKICFQHGITLYAGEPSIVEKGHAAAGFGPHAYLTGVHAFKYAHKILHESKKPSDLPIYFVSQGCKIAINLDAARQQDLTIPEELLLCLSRGMVYKDGKEL